jgi:hypothetical protein
VRKEHPLNKDSNKQQVNDDDVRDIRNYWPGMSWDEIEDWILGSESMLETYDKCMSWADPSEFRTKTVFHFGKFLEKQDYEAFKKFRWPFDWWLESTRQNFLIEMITQELEALLHEVADYNR